MDYFLNRLVMCRRAQKKSFVLIPYVNNLTHKIIASKGNFYSQSLISKTILSRFPIQLWPRFRVRSENRNVNQKRVYRRDFAEVSNNYAFEMSADIGNVHYELKRRKKLHWTAQQKLPVETGLYKI